LRKISVIIPTLNEAGRIEGAIISALGSGPQRGAHDNYDIEIIVADGGSVDKTRELAKALGAGVTSCPPGRGEQMDQGAALSTGDILLFLHADSRLPARWHQDVLKALEDPMISAGAFTLSIDASGWKYRVLEYLSSLRARRLGLIYGDQAIFTRAETFVEIGGFKKLPLFEDVDCVMKLKEKGKVLLIDKEVATSPRRWIKNGIVKNTLHNWFLLSLYMLGFSARGLYRRYYKSPLTR
jgi:rSAM/selenodomain-associated transferase 2